MTEKILNNKKHGMLALILTILLLMIGLNLVIIGALLEEVNTVLFVVTLVAGILILALGWIPLLGLKVLKPQEALVLTLFGKYIGTIKGDGFYYVNPFCVAVNPAAKTKLNQSGDVSSSSSLTKALTGGNEIDMVNKRISLKIMNLDHLLKNLKLV